MDSFLSAFTDPDTRWIPALLLAAGIAAAALRTRSLTWSGALATTFVGGAIVATGGWWLGVVLVSFFVSSSALSHGGRGAGDQAQQRGKRRDAVQVLANGGVPVLLGVIAVMASDPRPWLLAAVGAIAGATADTWATEIGRRRRGSPRLVTTWRAVPQGTSGAVSVHGTIGSALGATLIAAVAAIGIRAGWLDVQPAIPDAFAVLVGAGIAGSLVDSLLGATVQARRWCPACEVTTEQVVHRCGTTSVHHGGLRWLDNDVVNAVAIAAAGVIALGMSL